MTRWVPFSSEQTTANVRCDETDLFMSQLHPWKFQLIFDFCFSLGDLTDEFHFISNCFVFLVPNYQEVLHALQSRAFEPCGGRFVVAHSSAGDVNPSRSSLKHLWKCSIGRKMKGMLTHCNYLECCLKRIDDWKFNPLDSCDLRRLGTKLWSRWSQQ